MKVVNLNFRLSERKIIIICVILLNILSLTSLYSSLHQGGKFEGKEIFYKQIVWILISWLALLGTSFINYRLYYDFSLLFYGLNLLFLIVVIFFAKPIMGAQRWLQLGFFNFQPSEFSKLAVILILARFFSSQKTFLKGFVIPGALIALNAVLIFIQPDLGTAIIIVILFITMGIYVRPNRKYFIIFFVIGAFLSPFAARFLKDYQRKRLVVFINPNVDPLGAGYTIIQSKISIGSGKVFGKGFLSGTQNQFNFLPERHTDFIFTVIAEEWGLLGCIFLLILYWLILKKILDKTKELKDPFAYLLCYAITFFLFLHIFINPAMTLGILPVVGLPLVFLSYGGTHLLISFILLGIFFNISRSHQ